MGSAARRVPRGPIPSEVGTRIEMGPFLPPPGTLTFAETVASPSDGLNTWNTVLPAAAPLFCGKSALGLARARPEEERGAGATRIQRELQFRGDDGSRGSRDLGGHRRVVQQVVTDVLHDQ